MEANRKKDEQSSEDLRKQIDQQLKDTLFDISCQMRELETYKENYRSKGVEMEETQARIAKYMSDTIERLTFFMKASD